MSRSGNCWNNAVAESFFYTLKQNFFIKKFKTNEILFEYIEIFYNRKRIHSYTNYVDSH